MNWLDCVKLRCKNLDNNLRDKKATSTEAAQYFKAGYEAVVVGPGLSQGNSHSPNEKNSISELEKAIKFYEELILRVCL